MECRKTDLRLSVVTFEGWAAGVKLSKEEIAFITGILNKLKLID